MGGSNSKAEDRIELGQVKIWVEKRMHERYGMGMGRITPALTACMASLVATQRAAIEVGGAICVAMSGERSAEGRRPGEALAPEGKEKDALQALKQVADTAVQLVEVAAARENHLCPDYVSLGQTISNMRELHASLRDLQKHFSSPKLPAMSLSFNSAFSRFRDQVAGHPPVIDALEAAVQSSRLFLTEISDTKARILGPINGALSELAVVHRGIALKSTAQRRKQEFAELQAKAEEACNHHLLQEAKQLRLKCAALVNKMDLMLAPFVRIGQNVKGKNKIGRGDLTEQELQSIHKYIALLLLKSDMYEKLEDDGGSIEDFLEALFLLGIAAGVGMSDGNAKQTGLSRKSQAILADALGSFNADQLRANYTDWRRMHSELVAMEPTKEYKDAAEEADQSMAAYREVYTTHLPVQPPTPGFACSLLDR